MSERDVRLDECETKMKVECFPGQSRGEATNTRFKEDVVEIKLHVDNTNTLLGGKQCLKQRAFYTYIYRYLPF